MPALSATENERHNTTAMALDVRTKMIICLIASAIVIFFKGEVALAFFTAITTAYAITTQRWRLLGICYLATALMWLISIGFVLLLHKITDAFPTSSLIGILIPFLRSLVMLNTVLVLALTSRVQTLLAALKSLRLPWWLYIPAVVVIRFIPDFIQDIGQIHETMRTRGYNLTPFFLIRHPLLTVRLLVAPMLFRALRSADELAIAAELKGIGHKVAMSSYRPSSFGRNDVLALIATLATILCGIILEMSFESVVQGRMM